MIIILYTVDRFVRRKLNQQNLISVYFFSSFVDKIRKIVEIYYINIHVSKRYKLSAQYW